MMMTHALDLSGDGIDRRGFLECMAWAGTGVLWMMSGGILKSYGMSQMIDKTTGGLKKGLVVPKSDFSFVQISDSHIGFNKAANPDVVGTLQATIDKINDMPVGADPLYCIQATLRTWRRRMNLIPWSNR